MAEQKQKVKQKKTVKKRFFQIESKITATNIQLYAGSAEELIGKVITLDLTKSLRGKAFELRLKVKQENGELTTDPVSLQLFQSYVRKVVRKGTDYVEDSFETPSKDEILRIKPLLVTRKRVSRSILRTLMENARTQLAAYIKIRDSKEIFTDITSNKIQKFLAQKLKKIYPLALCEIRAVKVVSSGEKAKEEKTKTAAPKVQDSEEASEQ